MSTIFTQSPPPGVATRLNLIEGALQPLWSPSLGFELFLGELGVLVGFRVMRQPNLKGNVQV